MKKPLKYLLYAVGMLLSLGILAVMIYHAKDSFVKIWQGVRTKYLFLSLLSSVLIYIAMGMSLYEMLRIMGRRISKSAAIGIALVSTTVNYLISSLGASGFALRAHLLNRRRIPFGMCVTASIVITVLLYFVLAIIILQGSILMLFNSSATKWQLAENFGLIAGMCIVCVLRKLTSAIVYVCADWFFTIMVLYFAFRAVGVFLSPGVLVAGFAVGMVTTLIPILPSGLGAMELAMTAVFSQMGIDWDAALMATLIYRVVYYVIPGIVSIFIYWGLQLSTPENETKRRRKGVRA